MDYEKAIRTAQIFAACSGVNGVRCSSCPVFRKGDRNCARNAMKDGAAVINDLLVENIALRNAANKFEVLAEMAERERDQLREAMKPNCLLCDSMHENGNCTEVGGFCTAVPAAHCPLIPKLRRKITEADARVGMLENANRVLSARITKAEARAKKVEELIAWIYKEASFAVEHDFRMHLNFIKAKIEEWCGQKEG